MFTEHASEFAGKRVVEFQPGTEISDPENTAIALRVDYDDDFRFSELFDALLELPLADRIPALVFGAYSEEMYDDSMAVVVEPLVAAKDQLTSLTGLFLGDILSEENEVSWIIQTDLSPLWTAFPRLEHLQVRGSENLSLGRIESDYLKSLVIECGGLPAEVCRQVAVARLPALERLELYLGEDQYGWDGSIEDVRAILSAEYPSLSYLGLKDSQIQDEVAAAVVASPLLKQVSVLDMSLGELTDEGGRVLLEHADALSHLKLLDLHYNWMSEDVANQLAALPIEVDVSDRQSSEDDDFRYVAVGE